MFNASDLLVLYDKNDSYLWQCRKELLSLIEFLKRNGRLYFESEKLDAFINFYNQKKIQEAQIATEQEPSSDEIDLGDVILNTELGPQAQPQNPTNDLNLNLTSEDFQEEKSSNLSELKLSVGTPLKLNILTNEGPRARFGSNWDAQSLLSALNNT